MWTFRKNAFADRAPPEKASNGVVRRRLCQRWAMAYAYPGSISAFPVRGYSIAEEVVGVKYLDAIPFGCRGQAFKRLGGLQLQILGAGYWL